MSLIEKIDAEMQFLSEMEDLAIIEHNRTGLWRIRGRIQEAKKIKEFILLEQKEPLKNCSNCGNNTEYPKPHTCDVCTSLDQETEFEMWEQKPLTIGDKMRECGEKLSKFIETITNTKDTALSPEEAQELKAERDYWEREAKKWCAKLGEIRLFLEKSSNELH